MIILVVTFCFFCSVCQVVCVSVDISLNIRGYFITHSWIFHYASAVTRNFCFFFVVNCLHGVGFSHNAVFVFTHTNLTDLTKSSSIVVFCFTRISRKTRRFLSSLDFWSHTEISRKHTSLALVCTIRLRALGKADKRGRSDALSVRLPLAPSGGEHVS